MIDISSAELKFLPSFGELFPKGYQIQNAEAEFNIKTRMLEISINEPIAALSLKESTKLLQKEATSCFDIVYPEVIDGTPIILTTKYIERQFVKP